jgi:hypothetical protein
MLYRVSDLATNKCTTPYNAFVHGYHKKTETTGVAFVSEATEAYKEWKGTFKNNDEWDAACKELIGSFDQEKAELLKTMNGWSNGHSGIMALLMDKLTHEVFISSSLVISSNGGCILGLVCWGA